MTAQQKIEKLIKKIKADLLLDPNICSKCNVTSSDMFGERRSSDCNICLNYLKNKNELLEKSLCIRISSDNLNWVNQIAEYHLKEK